MYLARKLFEHALICAMKFYKMTFLTKNEEVLIRFCGFVVTYTLFFLPVHSYLALHHDNKPLWNSLNN